MKLRKKAEGYNMKNIGLVLEGGGMKGLYTAGVLEYFMERTYSFRM